MDLCELEVSLAYIESSRTAMATVRTRLKETKQETTTNNNNIFGRAMYSCMCPLLQRQDLEAGGSEFKVSLSSITSLRLRGATKTKTYNKQNNNATAATLTAGKASPEPGKGPHNLCH